MRLSSFPILPLTHAAFYILPDRNEDKSIEEVILDEERAELLQRVIHKLPEMQRRRFLLHYEYEMTYKEIGKIEHCSQQSVGRAVTAAREKIKAEMKKYLNA